MDALLQDLRYAFRHLRRSPGFAAAAILTLALGIGANTAMFTAINALLLQRLPIADPDGLVGMTSRDARGRERYLPFVAVQHLSHEGPFVDVCGYNGGGIISVDANRIPTQAVVAFVSGRCFDTFGVAPIIGRALTDEDAPLVTAGNRVVVIGHRFWMRMFGGDPNAIGQTIRTDGVEATIVGVLPPRFGGLHVDTGIDLFAPPDTLIPARADRRPVASQIVGRLRPGVTIEQAQAEMSARWPALLEASLPPGSNPLEGADLWGPILQVESFATGVSFLRARYVPALQVMLGLTALLLIVACVNLGGLLLTRLTARETELSVRLALGGSRRRIVQQMLVESLILSLAGASLALPVSWSLLAVLVSFIPPGLVTLTLSLSPDVRVLTVTAAAGVAVGVLMTTVPAWMAMRRKTVAGLGSYRTVVGTTSRWARALLVAQVAVSVVLVVGAGLLGRSIYQLQHVDLGLRTENVLDVRLMPTPNGRVGLNPASHYPELLDQIRALPGVRSAGYTQGFPRVQAEGAQAVSFVGGAPGDTRATTESVSPEFFTTVSIPLLAGRLPSWNDTSKTRRVVAVSESLARALSPDGQVLERRINVGTNQSQQDLVIVGVVGNASLGNPRLTAVPVVYFPALQRAFLNPDIIIDTSSGDFGTVATGVRRILAEAGREYAQEIVPVEDVFARAPSSERMSAALAAAVGTLAILLALIGIHGALAYAVSRRTREIGVRVAIGASPSEVARTVLREGFIVTLAGVAIGLPLAYLGARALRVLLYGTSESDPLTFTVTALSLLALGITAGVIPARRAASVDPAVALRAE
jgi:predicted permease